MKHAFFLFVILANSLYSEILDLQVTLSNSNCGPSCIQVIEKEFANIPGIASFVLQPNNTEIRIQWKPDVSFSYRPIYRALQRVGHSAQGLSITIKGSISSEGVGIFLTSEGDETQFQLLPPSKYRPFNASQKVEITQVDFPSSLKKELEMIQEQEQFAIVTGTLLNAIAELAYDPREASPYLVIQSLQMEEKKAPPEIPKESVAQEIEKKEMK